MNSNNILEATLEEKLKKQNLKKKQKKQNSENKNLKTIYFFIRLTSIMCVP